MDMRYVLLSSKGRIGSRTFLRGLTVITAAFMIVQVANTFISPLFGSDLSGAMDALTENIQEFERLTALTSLASFLLTTALLGFIAARLPTDLETNRYGPPTSGTPMSNTYS
jgi:uncharacterized membrane protein YhaH (DUF805 family)